MPFVIGLQLTSQRLSKQNNMPRKRTFSIPNKTMKYMLVLEVSMASYARHLSICFYSRWIATGLMQENSRARHWPVSTLLSLFSIIVGVMSSMLGSLSVKLCHENSTEQYYKPFTPNLKSKPFKEGSV